MAFNAQFYTFSKRENSTLLPTGTGTTMSVELKDDCSVVDPILRIYHAANFNPSALNYCYIPIFSRYYFIQDWTYTLGEWEAQLTSDPLASYKTQIGALQKYVVRSSYESDPNVIDNFYPSISQQPDYQYDYGSLGFTHDMTSGSFIVGIANNSAYSIGAITYYRMSYNDLENLIQIMLPDSQVDWLTSFQGLTDTLYRSIYDPFSYIKTCRWFPFTIGSESTGGHTDNVRFGNYVARDINGTPVMGDPIRPETQYWHSASVTLQLPVGWTALPARSRSKPYAHIYLVCNPWGVIELDPIDFTNTRDVKIYFYPDLISGDAFLKVYKVVGSNEYFLLQRSAKISVDIPLTAQMVDVKGFFSGINGVLTSGAQLAVGNAQGALDAAGAAGRAAESMVPSICYSTQGSYNSVRALEGTVTLVSQSSLFVDSDNDEFGKPLYKVRTLSAIPGFIKCGDPEHNIPASLQEKQKISSYLTEGFYYE